MHSNRRRKWQPTLVFLPGESHGQRSLVGCSPWGRTELDTTEVTWQQHSNNDLVAGFAQAGLEYLIICLDQCLALPTVIENQKN